MWAVLAAVVAWPLGLPACDAALGLGDLEYLGDDADRDARAEDAGNAGPADARAGASADASAGSDARPLVDAAVAGDAGPPIDFPPVLQSPVTLAASQVAPRGIGVDGTRVYWIEGTHNRTGSLHSLATDGSESRPSPLAANLDAPQEIFVGVSKIFFTVAAADAPTQPQCVVMWLPKAPTSERPLCMTRARGFPTRAAHTSGRIGLLVKGAEVTQATVGFASKPNAATPNVETEYVSQPTVGVVGAVAATDTVLLVGNARGPVVDTRVLPSLATDVSVCGSGCGTGEIVDIVIEPLSRAVVWATTTGDVLTAPLDTRGVRGTGKKLATLPAAARRLAVDSRYAYVTAGSSVYAVHIDTPGVVVPLSTSESTPFAIATDGRRVYWTDDAAGKVRATLVP